MSVFNGRQYLREAVESILGQSFADFEFLIVNDGSTDATPDIVAEYAARDSRIVLIHNPDNVGLTRSLNRGLAVARGQYVARQDADDVSLPGRLALQVEQLDRRPEAVLAFGSFKTIDARGRELELVHKRATPALARWYLLFFNYVGCHGLTLMRREAVLAAGGYNADHRYSQDYDLWLRLADVGDLTAVAEPLGCYRIHDARISAAKADAQESISLEMSRRRLSRLLGRELSLDSVAELRRFWIGPPQGFETAAELEPQLQEIHRRFLEEEAARGRPVVETAVAVSEAMVERLKHAYGSERLARRRPRLSFGRLWSRARRAIGRVVPGTLSSRNGHVTPKAPPPKGTVPEVSVLMPVYNAAPYLAEAVNSILGQTFRAFELIAVDDGSTDGSLGILRRFAAEDPRVRLVCCPHAGIVGALNDGLAMARADLLARMDADDVALPERLARQVAYMRAHPECVLLGTALQVMDPDGEPICHLWCRTSHEELAALPFQIREANMFHNAVMMRTAVLREVGGYRKAFEWAEDFDLWLRLAERGRLANLNEALVKYRLHRRSVSHLRAAEQRRRVDLALIEACDRRGLPRLPLRDGPLESNGKDPCEVTWMHWAFAVGEKRNAFRLARKWLLAAPLSPERWKVYLRLRLQDYNWAEPLRRSWRSLRQWHGRKAATE